SDGVVTGGVTLITDYRFNFGLILATNLGLWLRPDTQFAGVRIGNMAQFGVAAEMYVVQRWGLSVIGEVYGYPSLTSFPDSPKQVPAEALLGIRWQTKHGITITFGGSFGAACGFGSPAVRFFNGITWQPKSSREQEHINRLLLSGSGDRDDDGVDDEDDRCPYIPGPPEDLGCPNIDSDNDGVLDRDDECPKGKVDPYSKGKMGCPSVYIADEQIVVLKPIYFARDKDIILDESKPTLDDIARVLKHHPEVREIVIEGHTNSRAGVPYNMNLSQRRVHKVMAALVARGVEPARMTAKGYGQSELEYDDSTCTMPDEELTPDCRFMISKNERIVFRIKRIGVVPPRPLTGAPGEGTLPFEKRILPYSGDGVLPRIFRNKSGEVILPYPMRKELEKKLKPNSVRKKPGKKLKPKPVRQEESKPNPPGTLPKSGVLKKTKDGVLGSGSVLPSSSTKDPAGGQGLKKEGVLPSSRGVLPRSGTPEAAPPSAPTPPSKGTAPEPAPKGSATPPPPPVFE
ncbi:MAG: OmpA family protein, partial [Polyangiaceae bacterium]|nr:OmpA family protein [Polyangiaceae bacterium]